MRCLTILLTLIVALAGFAQEPAPHSLTTDVPGRPILPLWGWESTPFYQRMDDRIVGPEFVRDRAVDESFRRGANILEIYRGGFPADSRGGWTLSSTRNLNREIHERDMVVHWFPHRLQQSDLIDSRVVSLVLTGRAGPDSTFDGADRLLDELMADFDALQLPATDLLDGFGTEQWPEMHPRAFNEVAWPYNPALYQYTDNHMYIETLPNQMDCSASNGYGADDQTTGYHQLYDVIEKQYGMQFWGSQAECRTGTIPGNSFGGRGHPDWIVKQVGDQFRIRARVRDATPVSPAAIWWINEAENVCPDENRDYVYGVSQDPIRGAVAARLTMLGEGGGVPGRRGIGQRFPYSATSTFIQNNYLRAMILPDGRMELLHDPKRLAHYDNNSHAMRLSDSLLATVGAEITSETTEILEPAGYVSVARSTVRLAGGGSETRTLSAQSDSPWLRVRIERIGQAGALVSRIALPGYDRLAVGDKAVDEVAGVALVPFVVYCTDSTRPPLALLVLERGGLSTFDWKDGHLDLHSDSGEAFEVALVLFDGLYRPELLHELRDFLATPREVSTMSDRGSITVANPFGIPVVDVVRVKSGPRGPYQVREFGRWMHRGAQPSKLHSGEDYVKVYLPARGEASIQNYGFINDCVRPGWGCQYTTAVLDAKREGARCSVDVAVETVNAFLFAPRLRFAQPIARAWLDGAPWSYFDEDELFLPNRPGRHHVEVETGDAEAPHIARTFADLSRVEAKADTLTFDARLPEWVHSVPEGFHFMALVRHPGRTLSGLENARRVRGKEGASVIAFVTGTVALRFDGNGDVPAYDAARETDRLRASLSADMLRDCLSPFRVIDLAYDQIDGEAAGECDVFVWNRYFQDDLPPGWNGAGLRARVEAGKGALLLCNAVRAMPGMESAEAVHYGHKATKVSGVKLLPRAPRHPVFARLPGVDFMISARRGYGVAKWVAAPVPEGATLLADLRVDWSGDAEADPTPSPIPGLWTLDVGRGKLLGCNAGLAYGLGGVPRNPQHAETKRFIEDSVRWLAGKEDPTVGLVR